MQDLARISAAEAARTAGKSAADDVDAAATAAGDVLGSRKVLPSSFTLAMTRPSGTSSWLVEGASWRGLVARVAFPSGCHGSDCYLSLRHLGMQP